MPLFTGLSFFAQTWWQLLIFRFLAALGIGGEWAVGASLLSETWPTTLAAVDGGGAADRRQHRRDAGRRRRRSLLADYPTAYVFLVGMLPALLVLWIRRAVPEPEEWHAAKRAAGDAEPRFVELFRGRRPPDDAC